MQAVVLAVNTTATVAAGAGLNADATFSAFAFTGPLPGTPPLPVGGEIQPIDPAGLPLATAGSSGTNYGVLAGVIAGVVAAAAIALSGAAWYTRRRFSRS